MAKFDQFLARILLAGIHIYQWSLSPLFGNRCRFYPSCSQYAKEAIEKHGALYGSFLIIKRVFKCHPWHQGGIDHVP